MFIWNASHSIADVAKSKVCWSSGTELFLNTIPGISLIGLLSARASKLSLLRNNHKLTRCFIQNILVVKLGFYSACNKIASEPFFPQVAYFLYQTIMFLLKSKNQLYPISFSKCLLEMEACHLTLKCLVRKTRHNVHFKKPASLITLMRAINDLSAAECSVWGPQVICFFPSFKLKNFFLWGETSHYAYCQIWLIYGHLRLVYIV